MHVAPCSREKNAGQVCVLVGQRADCLDWSFSIIAGSAREAERPAWESTVLCNVQWITYNILCLIVPVRKPMIVTTEYRSKQKKTFHTSPCSVFIGGLHSCNCISQVSSCVTTMWSINYLWPSFLLRMYSLKIFGTQTFLSCFCRMWKLPLITQIKHYLFDQMWFGKFHCKHREIARQVRKKIWKLLPATYLKLRHCHSNCLSVLTQQTSISGERFPCDSDDPFEAMLDAQEAWGTRNAKAYAGGLHAANEEVSLSFWEEAFMDCNWYNLSCWMMDIYLVLQNRMTNDY